MFAALHLDGVEAGVAGLAGVRGSVGTVAGALGDEACAERVSQVLGGRSRRVRHRGGLSGGWLLQTGT